MANLAKARNGRCTDEIFTNTCGALSTNDATQYQAMLDLAFELDFDEMGLASPGKFLALPQNTLTRERTKDICRNETFQHVCLACDRRRRGAVERSSLDQRQEFGNGDDQRNPDHPEEQQDSQGREADLLGLLKIERAASSPPRKSSSRATRSSAAALRKRSRQPSARRNTRRTTRRRESPAAVRPQSKGLCDFVSAAWSLEKSTLLIAL